MIQKNFASENWKEYLPIPVCEDFPEYEEFYMTAWELAYAHIKHVPGMPQTPYMDEGFCDLQVWIWDTCFMSLFCKFAQQVFPGIETFNNFYQVLYDGKRLAKVMPTEKDPEWSYEHPGVPNEIKIHIADNPPLFAWGEYENVLISGDIQHIKELLCKDQYLQKHYEWFETLKTKVMLPGVSNETCLIAEELGFRWEGGRSGMDNTPRGRKAVGEDKERPNDPDLLWVDAICQQALTADVLAKMYRLIGDEENAALWQARHSEKRKIVNTYYWDQQDRFYYDIDVNSHEFCKVMTVASYWPLTAGIADQEQAAALAAHLSNPDTFGGELPLLSLARNDGDFYEDGRYWRGGFWLPTAYAALKGLTRYQYHEEVQIAAHKMFRYMLQTYQNYEPHTIWECYAPEGHKPSLAPNGKKIVGKDFCGWSALGPISIYLEYVLGFHTINAFENLVEWSRPKHFTGRVGIKNLCFGSIRTDITAKDGVCEVVSNGDYTLKIDGRTFAVKAGMQKFSM